MKYVSLGNVGQNIVDKFTKLFKKGFPVEYFTAGFLHFLAQMSEFTFSFVDWVLTINSKHFMDFLESF